MPTLDSKYAPDAFPKTCSCGTVYDQAAWERLEWASEQHPMEFSGLKLPGLETRMCKVCGEKGLGSHVSVRLRE